MILSIKSIEEGGGYHAEKYSWNKSDIKFNLTYLTYTKILVNFKSSEYENRKLSKLQWSGNKICILSNLSS